MSWKDQSEPVETPAATGPVSNDWSKVADPVTPPERTVIPRGALGNDTLQESLEIPLAISEQVGAGLYALGTDAVAGSRALFKASVAKAAGMSFGDTFNEEYKIGKDALPEYVPITAGGKKLSETLSGIMGKAVQAYGDTAFTLGHVPVNPIADPLEALIREKTGRSADSAASGALGQAAATLAMLATPGLKEGKAAKPSIDPIDAFKVRYPRTAASLDASKVGKVDFKPLEKDKPISTATVKVMNAVDHALNEELGIDPGKLTEAQGRITFGDKLKMVIAKHGGNDVPMADQIKLANAVSDKFMKLQEYQDAVIASRAKLPDKTKTMVGTPEGTILTPEQAQDFINGIKPRARIEADTSVVAKKGRKKKQAGMFDVEGVDKNVPAAQEAIKKATEVGWTQPGPDAAKKAEQALDANYIEKDNDLKKQIVNALKVARRVTVQHDYDLQHDLAATGKLGEDAMLSMQVRHNANMIAKGRYDAAGRQIFDDLHGDDLRNLEKIIRARRIVQIDAARGVGKVQHEMGTTGPEQLAFLNDLRNRLGPDKYEKLNDKATAVFTEDKINPLRLHQEGLITDEEFNRLSSLSLTRTEYLDILDPSIPVTSHSEGIHAVRSSGIARLARDKEIIPKMGAKDQMIEDIARVENRIARNKTLQAMYAVAENNPGNGVVELVRDVGQDGKVKHMPRGFTSIGVKINGEMKHVAMRDEYADQFLHRPDAGLNRPWFPLGDYQFTTGSFLRAISGSSLLRASATTYNPWFIFAGLPMDIVHLWMASKGAYSPHLPVYLMQIGKDLAATAKDALTHKGEWEQAMKEGMGPNFMTHEARGLTDVLPSQARAVIAPKAEALKKVLSYAGDTQDTWVRLAHRHRLIEQGHSSATATAMAVQRLNYSRGGILVKYIDTVIPYTNITVNAGARFIENAHADPVGTATKLAWFTGLVAATKLANMIASPETDKAVSSQDKARNFIITFGDQYYILDPDGNKRYLYLPLRMDQVVMPFNAAVVSGLEWAEYGRAPDGVLKEAVGQISPLTTMFPPSFNAVRAYVDNYDPFRDSSIYKGPKVLPEDQVRSYARGQATPALFEKAGKLTGMSPMGLQAAAGQLVNTNNFWLSLMGGFYKAMFQGMDPREQSESTLLYLQHTPLNRLVKLTSPATQDMMKGLEDSEQKFGSVRAKEIRALDELMFQYRQGQAGVTPKTIQNWISAQPEDDRQMLAKHAKVTSAVDMILKHYKASEGVPPRAWWIASSKVGDDARAEQFYNQWVSAEPDGRKRMLEIANALHNNGVGYVSPRFQRKFAEERRLLGDDRR